MKHEVPEGVVVRFGHGRRAKDDWGHWHRKKEGWGRWDPEGTTDGHRTHSSDEISTHGGRTHCKLTLPDGTEIFGVAECSGRDQYNKKIGRDIALGRALKNAATKHPELFNKEKQNA